jgi:hypothetical protein
VDIGTSVRYIEDKRNEIEDKDSAGLGIEEITRSRAFDFQRFQGIFETAGMNFAKESGRESSPVNRSFETSKMNDESLESDMHIF